LAGYLELVKKQLDNKFWEEEMEGQLEFVKLQGIYGLTYEEAQEVHSTYGDYIEDRVTEAIFNYRS
jgi:hypothetical protein